MAPTTLSLTITAIIDPPLDETSCPEIGDQLGGAFRGDIATTAWDSLTGWASWTLHLPVDEGHRFGHHLEALHARLLDVLPAKSTATVTGLEGITLAEATRRYDALTKQRDRLGITEVPDIPEVVTTAEFARLLEVSPQRVRALRAERIAADAVGGDHPFPREVFTGHWRKDDADAYAELDRPTGVHRT